MSDKKRETDASRGRHNEREPMRGRLTIGGRRETDNRRPEGD